MAELKTRPDDKASAEDFINGIADEARRQDSAVLAALMREVTGIAPRMWGSSIVGFGDRHYRYASGREGDTFVVGFSPRKEALTIYTAGYLEQFGDLLERLGKHKAGKGCLYIKRLQDVDLAALRDVIERSVRIGTDA